MRPSVIGGCLGFLLALLLPVVVGANIGPNWWGDRTAEPLGLKGVAIAREKRTLDLRPLAAAPPVAVERNRIVDLSFRGFSAKR
jgi:hypothetical protein